MDVGGRLQGSPIRLISPPAPAHWDQLTGEFWPFNRPDLHSSRPGPFYFVDVVSHLSAAFLEAPSRPADSSAPDSRRPGDLNAPLTKRPGLA